MNAIDLLDFDSLTTDEISAVIEELTARHKERVARDNRRKKAEEYENRIYDLISEAQYDGFTIRINDAFIPNEFAVDVDY